MASATLDVGRPFVWGPAGAVASIELTNVDDSTDITCTLSLPYDERSLGDVPGAQLDKERQASSQCIDCTYRDLLMHQIILGSLRWWNVHWAEFPFVCGFYPQRGSCWHQPGIDPGHVTERHIPDVPVVTPVALGHVPGSKETERVHPSFVCALLLRLLVDCGLFLSH